MVFTTSLSILFSGNNFSKIELFARFLKLAFPGQSTFTRLQTRYLVPAVDELWTAKQTTIVEELTHQDLVILSKINMCVWGGGGVNIKIYAFIDFLRYVLQRYYSIIIYSTDQT